MNKSAVSVGQLMAQAPTLDVPRSSAYLMGFHTRLEKHVHGVEEKCPYPIGSEKADAFECGAIHAEELLSAL
jgi:hypothetical protein